MIIIWIAVVLFVLLLPYFIGWVLNNFFNTSSKNPPTLYWHIWTAISGALTAWAISFAYTISTDTNLTPSGYLTNKLDIALPYIYAIATATIAAHVFYIFSNNWEDRGRKIIASANQSAENILKEAKAKGQKIISDAEDQRDKYHDQMSEKHLQIREERQELERDKEYYRLELEAEFERKKQSWMEQIKNLKLKLSQSIGESEIKDEIIKCFDMGNIGGVERAKKDLFKFQSQQKLSRAGKKLLNKP